MESVTDFQGQDIIYFKLLLIILYIHPKAAIFHSSEKSNHNKIFPSLQPESASSLPYSHPFMILALEPQSPHQLPLHRGVFPKTGSLLFFFSKVIVPQNMGLRTKLSTKLQGTAQWNCLCV